MLLLQPIRGRGSAAFLAKLGKARYKFPQLDSSLMSMSTIYCTLILNTKSHIHDLETPDPDFYLIFPTAIAVAMNGM